MEEINLQRLVKIALDRIWFIIAAAVLCCALIISYCVFIASPVYSTKSSILVNNGALADTEENFSSISTSTISASLYLVDTCVDVLKSPNMYKELAAALNNEYTYTELQKKFTVTSRSTSSLFIDIETVDTSREEAKRIANTFLSIIPDYMNEVIPAVDVKIMSTADQAAKVSPRTVYLSLLALFFGAAFSYLIFLILDMLNKTINGEDDFKNRYDIPLLGVVPNFDQKKSGGKHYGSYE